MTVPRAAFRAAATLRVLAWGAFVVAVAAVAYVSLLPAPSLPPLGSGDKVVHALIYALLAASAAMALRDQRRPIAIGCGLFVFGALLEVLQGFAPGRECSLFDALANGGGIAAGLALVALARHSARRTITLWREGAKDVVATASAAATGCGEG